MRHNIAPNHTAGLVLRTLLFCGSLLYCFVMKFGDSNAKQFGVLDCVDIVVWSLEFWGAVVGVGGNSGMFE